MSADTEKDPLLVNEAVADTEKDPLLLVNEAVAAERSCWSSRWCDFLKCYGLLGFIAFGGPQSHMAILKNQVEQRKWLSPETFSELFSLCMAIPGPSSSQLVVAVGIARQGPMAGLLGYLLFFLPGFIVMLTLGSLAGVYFTDGFVPPFYLSSLELGLSCAALALIGSNSVSLGKTICTHKVTQLICAGSTIVTLLFQQYWCDDFFFSFFVIEEKCRFVFPAVFAASAAVSFVYFSIRPNELATDKKEEMPNLVTYSKWVAVVVLAVSLSALIALIVLR